MSAPTPADIIRIAKSQVGVHEGRSGGHWNNQQPYSPAVPGLEWSQGQAWCATFVSWVAMKAGASALYPRTASCDTAANWFRSRGQWSEWPALGAQVFFGSAADLVHTGIVIGYNEDNIVTVEGNTNDTGSREGDGVYIKTRRRHDPYVVGYGYPKFAVGLTSADPNYRKPKAGKHKPSTPSQTQPVTNRAARIDLVDASHYQSGKWDLSKAKNAGVRAVIHKATESTGFVDDHYETRRAGVKAAGLVWGGYHFARPGASGATAQARHFLSVAKLVPGDIAAFDLEDAAGLTAAQIDTWAREWCLTVEKALGPNLVIYTPFPLGAWASKYKLWVARYSSAMTAPKSVAPWGTNYSMWQFSNGVLGNPSTVPGIGKCDINTLAGDPAKTLASLLITGPAKPAAPLAKVDLSNVVAQAKAARPLPGVKKLQSALNAALGTAVAVDGVFGPQTRAAYIQWQLKLGYTGADADGVPGRESLTKLAAGRFRVVE